MAGETDPPAQRQAAASPSRAAAPRPRFRGLAIFWGVVIVGIVGGAIGLEMMGPVPPPPAPPGERPENAARPPERRPTTIAPPDLALEEASPDFAGRFLPVIAPDGRTAATLYAAPFDRADKHPRVALVLAGLGQDSTQTEHALADLPGAVTIAWSAYTPEAEQDRYAQRARETGHECLTAVPMEPSGYPLAEEGYRSLLTGADTEQNRQNLVWALSRFRGCVGATGASDGMMGERFAQAGLGFTDMLGDIGRRGLLYLDPRTGAPALAAAPAYLRIADVVIDAPAGPDQPAPADLIDRRLGLLVQIAAERGSAIGLAGPPKPVLLERLAVWVNALPARGLTLAPLSAMPVPQKSATTDAR